MRCQPTTVLGWTITIAERQSTQQRDNQTKIMRSLWRRRGRFPLRLYAASCRRSAKFSRIRLRRLGKAKLNSRRSEETCTITVPRVRELRTPLSSGNAHKLLNLNGYVVLANHRWAAGQACPLLLVAAGGGASEPAAVWRHATQDLGTAAAERVALPERGSTVFGSKKISQGAVSVGAPFSPLHQRP